ncbi:MAG: S-methyl-5-thioribose-1-phosphate isomerase, partial [Sphaerochaetaceae bacterium]
MDETFITLEFRKGILHLIDQRLLPVKEEMFLCSDYRDVEFAIRDMVVRGAPAIGATAAYGVVLAAMEYADVFDSSKEAFRVELQKACDVLEASRPTAVNLAWALRRMLSKYDSTSCSSA